MLAWRPCHGSVCGAVRGGGLGWGCDGVVIQRNKTVPPRKKKTTTEIAQLYPTETPPRPGLGRRWEIPLWCSGQSSSQWMSHVLLLSGWLTSLLLRTTHCVLKCFYLVVYFFNGSCNLVGFMMDLVLGFIFTLVLDTRSDALESVLYEN